MALVATSRNQAWDYASASQQDGGVANTPGASAGLSIIRVLFLVLVLNGWAALLAALFIAFGSTSFQDSYLVNWPTEYYDSY
jgi:hypothetical protein